jgi:type I restriction enzyme S subunit
VINDNLFELAKGLYRKALASSVLTETKIKEFATITMGQSPSSKTYNKNGVGMALLNGAADFRNGIHTSKWTTDAKRIVDKGAYIFGVRATIGLTTKVFSKYAIGRGTGSANIKDTVNDEFLYFVLNDMFKYFANSGSGSVYINISKSDFNNYVFDKPQDNVLQTFHKNVGPIMNQIYANKQENLVLNQVREILLNRFF